MKPVKTTRREALRTAGLSLAAVPAMAQAHPDRSPQSRPNIMVIHCHDVGRQLGCYGRGLETPNLDRLARGGHRFDQYFSTAPFCAPSRCSRMTGLYPVNHGCMGLPHSWNIRQGIRTLPMYLNDAGYETHLFGLQHEAADVATLGYKHYQQGSGSPGAPRLALDVTPRVLDFLEEHDPSGAPFYMDVGFYEAHMFQPGGGLMSWTGSAAPPRFKPKYVTRSELRQFRGQLAVGVNNPGDPYKREYDPEEVQPLPYLPDLPGIREDVADLNSVITNVVDAMVGRILEKLKEKELDQDTLVVFVTDHGLDMPRAKGSLYDPGTEVALIMRYPRRFQPGQVHHSLLSHVDFLPTILDFAGHPAPTNLDGQSFLALLEGRPYRGRESLYQENTWHAFYDPMRAVRTDRYKYIRNFAPKKNYWAIESKAAREVLGRVLFGVKPLEEFYDLDSDPYEQRNLAPVRYMHRLRLPPHREARIGKDLLASMRQQLRDHMLDTDDPLLKGPVPHPDFSLMWEL